MGVDLSQATVVGQPAQAAAAPAEPAVDLSGAMPVGATPPDPELLRARNLVQSMPERAPFSMTPDRGQVGMGRAMVSGVRQVLDLAQRLEHAAPQSFQNLINKTTPLGMTPDQLYEKWKKGPLQMNEASDQALQEDPAAVKGGQQASMLPWLIGGGPVANGVRSLIPRAIAKAVPKTTATLVGAGTGAALANATDPANAGLDKTEEGAIGGALIPGAAGALAALGRPLKAALTPAMSTAVRAMDRAGIPVDAMQRWGTNTGDLVRRYLSDSPGGHGVMADANAARGEAYTAAQLRNTGEVTPTVHTEQMMDRLKTGLDNVAARAGVQVDMPLHQAMANLEQNASQITTTPGPALANMRTLINSAANNPNQPGVIPGTILQQVRSNLSGLAKQGDPLSAQLNDVLTQHFERQVAGTPLANEWAVLRNQYKNAKIIQKATTNDLEGQLRPSVVSTQLRNKYNLGRNTPDSQDPFVQTSRAYQQLVDRYPNSGTAHRTALQHMVAAPVGAAIGALSDSDNRKEGAIEGALLAPAALMSGQYLGAKLINNPGFSRYVLGQTRSLPAQAAQAASQLPAYLSAMYPELATTMGNQEVQQKAAGGKIEKTMHEFKTGDLHSGSKTGKLVTSRNQAIAIALNQQRRENAKR